MYENLANIQVNNRLNEGLESQYAARNRKKFSISKFIVTRIIALLTALFT